MVTITDEIAVARAFGLGGDMMNSILPDPFNGLVYSTGEQWGFITRTRYNDTRHQELDRTLLLIPSQVILHDGVTEPVFNRTWNYFGQRKDDRTFCRKDFRVPGATFAATERRGVPERVFLFFAAPGFNVVYIIEQLKAWRIAHPPQYVPASLPRKQELPRFLQKENKKRYG